MSQISIAAKPEFAVGRFLISTPINGPLVGFGGLESVSR